MKRASFVEGLTNILVQRNVIPVKEARALAIAFHHSGKSTFDEFLLDEGLVEKENLLQALADYYQVPAFDAVGYFFDHQLVQMFPKEFLRSNGIIPIEEDENIMYVLANNPADANIVPRIGTYVSYDIQFQVGILQDILDAIEEFYDAPLTDNREYEKGFMDTREANEELTRKEGTYKPGSDESDFEE